MAKLFEVVASTFSHNSINNSMARRPVSLVLADCLGLTDTADVLFDIRAL